MKIEQMVWTKAKGWSAQNGPEVQGKVQLVIIFAATEILKENIFLKELKNVSGSTSLRLFHSR